MSNIKPPRPARTPASSDYEKLGQQGSNFGTIFQKIDEMRTVDAVTNYIGSFGRGTTKHLAWNFAHIGEGNINTIEFRRYVHFYLQPASIQPCKPDF